MLSNDLKDIIRLVILLGVLLVLSWVVVFYSNVDLDKRQLLYPNHRLNDWVVVSVDGINYKISKSAHKVEQTISEYEVSDLQWQNIQADLSRIIVLEESNISNEYLEKEFSQNSSLISIRSESFKWDYFLGALNPETGNFWVKEIEQNLATQKRIEKFYLCRSEIYFEGFYQTELEGHRMSYLRFQNYFLQPFKSWYGSNFWSNGQIFSLRTEKNNLFTIDKTQGLIHPKIPSEVSINAEFLKNYLSLVTYWVPPSIFILSDKEIEDKSNENNFILEIKTVSEQTIQLELTDSGLLWKEKKIFFPAPQEYLNQLIILPDNFYSAKITTIENHWNYLQKNPDFIFEWKNLKTGFNAKKTYLNIKNQNDWMHFFCFLAGCLTQEQIPLMKIRNIPPDAIINWQKSADYSLSLKNQVYYFFQSTYKLQVLTPDGIEFSFISRNKDIYPKLQGKPSIQKD